MILGFKGFKPGLIATLGDGSYQYQPGEVSKTEKAKCANTGFRWTALTGMLGTEKTSSGPSQLAVISMRMTTGRGAAVPKLYRFAG